MTLHGGNYHVILYTQTHAGVFVYVKHICSPSKPLIIIFFIKVYMLQYQLPKARATWDSNHILHYSQRIPLMWYQKLS